MGEYMGTKEAGVIFGCVPSYVAKLCREGKIPGAEQDAPGSPWRIPSNAKKSIKKTKNERNNNMKKIISALLALTLSVSLCACGNTDATSTEDTTTGAQTTETTASSSTASSTTATTATTTATTAQTESEEEKQLTATKARYEKAKKYLAEYLKDGNFNNKVTTLSGNRARRYLYKEFEACRDYEDSAEILAHFTVFPDMLMSITNTQTDNLGNISESTYASYEYDEKGSSLDNPIFELLGLSMNYRGPIQYDDTGRIISVKMKAYNGTIKAIITPEYNENGNIVKATIQTNDDTYTNTYTYDAQNRLIAVEKYMVNSDIVLIPHSYTYSYDENGNLTEENYSYLSFEYKTTYSYGKNGDLLKKVYTHLKYKYVDENGDLLKEFFDVGDVYVYEYEYEYDANGYLVMKKETYTQYYGETYESQIITQFLYTNDENGRPISAELIKTVDGKNSYASQILTYNYETLYFYNAE